MNKKTRLQIYKRMLVDLEKVEPNTGTYCGFCYKWGVASNWSNPMADGIELMTYEPKVFPFSGFWFDPFDPIIRIEILEEIIKKMENPWYKFWK